MHFRSIYRLGYSYPFWPKPKFCGPPNGLPSELSWLNSDFQQRAPSGAQSPASTGTLKIEETGPPGAQTGTCKEGTSYLLGAEAGPSGY